MDFDTFLIKKVKPFGYYQKCMVVFLSTPLFLSSFTVMAISFLIATPTFHCSEDAQIFDGYNLTSDLDSCKAYSWNTNLSTYGEKTRVHNLSHVTSIRECKRWNYDHSQYVNTLVTKWNLICKDKWKAATISTSFVIGMLLSGFTFSCLADMIGRRYTYITACVGTVIIGISIAFVENYILYCIFRCLLGFTSLATVSVSYILALEIIGPSYRVYVATFMMLTWTAGYMVLALIAYLIRDHFTLQLVLGCSHLILLFPLWCIPESPRWLLSKGMKAKAFQTCKTFAKWNRVDIPEDFDVYVEKDMKKKLNPLDLVKTPKMRTNTLILFYGWIAVSFTYYGISWNTSNLKFGGDDYLNFFISALVEIPAYFFNMFALNKFGRRWSASVSMAIPGILLLTIIFIPSDIVMARVTLAMIAKFFVTAAYAMVYQYTSELYPTVVRTLGFGCCTTMARIGGIVASYILLLGDVSPILPLILLGTAPFISGILFLLPPETKGRPLPQTVEEAEQVPSPKHPFTMCCKSKVDTDANIKSKNRLEKNGYSHCEDVTKEPTKLLSEENNGNSLV